MTTALKFRNIDASPDDPVETWPFEGILAAVDRGTLPDWRRLAAAIRDDPWGPVAEQVLEAICLSHPYGTAELLEGVVARARNLAIEAEREVVASEVRDLVGRSGLSRQEFARRIGTSRSRLSTYMSGKVVPSATLMVRMRRVVRHVPKLVAVTLAEWAAGLEPSQEDLELARRSLLDTVAVALAARDHRVTRLAAGLPEGARWAVAGHVLDFDDLHMPSTTHVSAVCVPAALAVSEQAVDGGARAYLAAAGVMARLGTALGWRHYSAGWHATCTAGAPAAAAGAAIALGLPAERIAAAMALAVPAAGGVQRAFGTDAKSLQVGFAVEAGIRAARLAAAGARADPGAVDAWLELVGGDPAAVDPSGPAVPNGLAVKLYPCCYALQRPISTLSGLAADPAAVRRIVLRTPHATVLPLIHHRPRDGLQGKFSLEYAAAAALLDGYPGFGSFTDEAVRRDEARRLAGLVETELEPGGSWLLDGELEAEIHHADGTVLRASQRFPPGSPARPPTAEQLAAKLADCVRGLDTDPASWTWENAATTLRRYLP